MSKNLLNDNKVQGVMINLDRDKPRELRFRQYLDAQRQDGITMKESILRLFEQVAGQATIPNIPQPIPVQKDESKIKSENIKITDQKEEVNGNDFDMI